MRNPKLKGRPSDNVLMVASEIVRIPADAAGWRDMCDTDVMSACGYRSPRSIDTALRSLEAAGMATVGRASGGHRQVRVLDHTGWSAVLALVELGEVFA